MLSASSNAVDSTSCDETNNVYLFVKKCCWSLGQRRYPNVGRCYDSHCPINRVRYLVMVEDGMDRGVLIVYISCVKCVMKLNSISDCRCVINPGL